MFGDSLFADVLFASVKEVPVLDTSISWEVQCPSGDTSEVIDVDTTAWTDEPIEEDSWPIEPKDIRAIKRCE